MKKTLITHIKRQLEHQPGVIAILLFGSQVTSKTRPDSDVDIAVLFEFAKIPAPLELLQLQQQLAEVLQHDVDLVCLNQTNPILGSQIYKNHQILLVKKPHMLAEYFSRTITDYAELKEYRRPMEEAILKRKYYD